MSVNRERTVFIGWYRHEHQKYHPKLTFGPVWHFRIAVDDDGNLDEKVCDRVLYDILIQAGRVVDLHIPRDRETDKPRGFAFAEYETEEIAEYAVKLFSGLVTLYSRTLRFAISGQDNRSSNVSNTASHQNSRHNSSMEASRHHSSGLPLSSRVSEHPHHGLTGEPNSYSSHSNGNNQRTSESITRTRSHRYDSGNTVSYRPY